MFGVTIRAHERLDDVFVFASPQDAMEWAALADSLISAPHLARSGETLEVEGPSLGMSNAVELDKRVSTAGTRFDLYFSDRYDINTVLARIGRERAREFVAAVRRAARASAEMSGVQLYRERPLPPPPPASPIGDPSWAIVADPAAKVYFEARCTQGQAFVEMMKGGPVAVRYFRTSTEAEQAGFTRSPAPTQCPPQTGPQ
ncbi:MAG TPA: hypothetical protein VGB92_10155 [Longimicrobium sp.]|jgi:hypothetical protein